MSGAVGALLTEAAIKAVAPLLIDLSIGVGAALPGPLLAGA